MSGYRGIYVPKNSSDSRDGTAMFYLEAKIKVDGQGKPLVLQQGSAQVALVLICELIEGERKGLPFIVAGTHLKAKRGFEQKREAQGAVLLKYGVERAVRRIKEYQEKVEGGNGKDYIPPVVVVGDFNDTKDSLVCKKVLEHPLGLRSAYDKFYLTEEEEEEEKKKYASNTKLSSYYTTYKKREEETCREIDYIFYTPSTLNCSGVLRVPPLSSLPHRLPAVNYPSDHLSLLATFQFQKQ